MVATHGVSGVCSQFPAVCSSASTTWQRAPATYGSDLWGVGGPEEQLMCWLRRQGCNGPQQAGSSGQLHRNDNAEPRHSLGGTWLPQLRVQSWGKGGQAGAAAGSSLLFEASLMSHLPPATLWLWKTFNPVTCPECHRSTLVLRSSGKGTGEGRTCPTEAHWGRWQVTDRDREAQRGRADLGPNEATANGSQPWPGRSPSEKW